MLCERPFRKGVLEMGCGSCRACLRNRATLWVGRMLLESREHPFNSFVTLTYDEQHLPKHGLEKKHLQLFMKRLRDEFKPRTIRYYAVGEYGEQFKRPHFHLILFNVCPTEGEKIKKCWPNGFIHVGSAEAKSMRYVCGYIIKNMTKPYDRRLAGRQPEFSCMSLRPGIGHGAISRMAEVYASEKGKAALKITAPRTVRIHNKIYPLGRYLKDKILKAICVDKSEQLKYREQWKQSWVGKKEALTVTEYETARKAKVGQQDFSQKRRKLG